MGRRLILDTNVLIAIERSDPEVLRELSPSDELAIAAVVRAELFTGIELAESSSLRESRMATVLAALSNVTILDYTEATANHHAKLLAHTKQTGRPRGNHDLIIAAHAAETKREVFSRDLKARFGELPGVVLAESAI